MPWWQPAGVGTVTVTGPGGETMSAEWVKGDEGDPEGSWLVSGDAAVHALLDDALAVLQRHAVTAEDGAAGSGARGSEGSLPTLAHMHVCLGDLDKRVDTVYGQAVRDARADIVRFSNAFLEPDRSDLQQECPPHIEAAISAWEPGEPFPFDFDFREEMSESVRREARAHAAARNAPLARDDSF